jgi:hypothetical protein
MVVSGLVPLIMGLGFVVIGVGSRSGRLKVRWLTFEFFAGSYETAFMARSERGAGRGLPERARSSGHLRVRQCGLDNLDAMQESWEDVWDVESAEEAGGRVRVSLVRRREPLLQTSGGPYGDC